MDQQVKETTCSVKKRGSEQERGTSTRKRQEFLAYQNCDPLSQWWMPKASSDLSLLLICLAGALFSAERGWTLEHVTPVAACPNPLTGDTTAGPADQRGARAPQTTTADTCLWMHFPLCVLSFLHSFPHLSRPFKEHPSPRRKGTAGCSLAKGGSCI